MPILSTKIGRNRPFVDRKARGPEPENILFTFTAATFLEERRFLSKQGQLQPHSHSYIDQVLCTWSNEVWKEFLMQIHREDAKGDLQNMSTLSSLKENATIPQNA